ncbi:hypothetical protein HZA98_02345 [Candidatus Woesearchaeota archaeon]|nr:hypothetical protein [Candidatus Woesearchaeota archaeon]
MKQKLSIERYRFAKDWSKLYLEGQILASFWDYAQYLESKIISNPLYLYTITQEEEKK